MNKTAFAISLILALLVSAVAEPNVVNMVRANPIGMLPTEPEPLVVSLQSPKKGSTCLSETMSVAFSLKNPTLGGANSLTYMIDGQTRGNINGVITAKAGERFAGFFDILNYSATINLSGLTDGWHTLTIFASGTSPYDPEKGLNTIEADVSGSDSIQFLFDLVPPSISVLTPQNTTYLTNVSPLNFTLSEKSNWVGYSLDGQSTTTITGNMTLVGLDEGMHNLTVYAKDSVGRVGTSQTVYFNVTHDEGKVLNPQPTQPKTFPTTLVATASGASVVAVITGLLLYFKKHTGVK